MNAIDVAGCSYHYKRGTDALHALDLAVPTGAIYGLIGVNGAGKSTLLQCCAGLRVPSAGRIEVFGKPVLADSPIVAGVLSYVAEAVKLPQRMTLRAVLDYVAPLHRRWDAALLQALLERFSLDPSQRVSVLSRGSQMKAALLCALAARPRLLVMDEPFTGMDALVRDDLVRGLLGAATDAGTTVLVASHDLAELETMIDHLGIIAGGRMVVSGAMDALRERFQRVTVSATGAVLDAGGDERAWLGVERSARRLSFLADASVVPLHPEMLRARFPGADVQVQEPSVRELFTTLARRELPAERRASA
ncbi:MAG: ABC transporter ATP-binding protein [Gemmatimonadaceae bacterium]|nr:ABC transporter ATP-binding protein [Gemmatimonadaceae bacterium]